MFCSAHNFYWWSSCNKSLHTQIFKRFSVSSYRRLKTSHENQSFYWILEEKMFNTFNSISDQLKESGKYKIGVNVIHFYIFFIIFLFYQCSDLLPKVQTNNALTFVSICLCSQHMGSNHDEVIPVQTRITPSASLLPVSSHVFLLF